MILLLLKKNANLICLKCNSNKRCPYECLGHIQLAAPVVHIWYFDVIAKILELKKSTFKEILRYEKNFEDIEELKNQYSDDNFESADDIKFYKEKIDKFKDESGAVLIRELLELFDNSYDKEISRIENNAQKQNKKLTTRLELINKIKKSGNKFSWMVLDVLPVVPPSIRPEISIDGQIFEDAFVYFRKASELGERKAFSDLGDCFLYGWGCKQDFQKARECYKKASWWKNRKIIKKIDSEDFRKGIDGCKKLELMRDFYN